MKVGQKGNSVSAMSVESLSAYPRTIVVSKQRSHAAVGISPVPMGLLYIHARHWTLTLRSTMVNPTKKERINTLVQLLRDPSENRQKSEPGVELSDWGVNVLAEALTGSRLTDDEKTHLLGLLNKKDPWDSPPRDIRERLKDGQLLFDPEKEGDFSEAFSTLSEEEQEKFWANVEEESEWENYLAGGPKPKHWQQETKPVTMRPAHSLSPARLSLEQALTRLGRTRRRGKDWTARCPAHDTNHNSLVVSESPDWPGYPVFFCYAGCTHQAVKDALLERAPHA